MATRIPAISAPRTLNLPEVQALANNARERFIRLEGLIAELAPLTAANSQAQTIATLQQQLAQLTQAVTLLTVSPDLAVLSALLTQPNGLVVLKNGTLITRILQSGSSNITITYPDGKDGNPVITWTVTDLAGPQDAWGWWDDEALDEVLV